MVRVRRAAKKGGGAKIKRGCEKKGGAPHPPFFKKGGARSTGTPPVYAPGGAPVNSVFKSSQCVFYIIYTGKRLRKKK